MSLAKQYENLGYGQYLDVSRMDNTGRGAIIVNEVNPPSFAVQGIQLASNNVENYIQAIKLIWGPNALQDQGINNAINVMREMINRHRTAGNIAPTSYPSYLQARSPRQYAQLSRQYATSPRRYASSPRRYFDEYPRSDYSRYNR